MAWLGTKIFVKEDKYSFNDLNRVNENTQYIYDTMIAKGFTVTLPHAVVTTYTRTSFPTVTVINNTRTNIKALVDAFPEVKRLIEDTGMYTGTFYAGERGMEYGTSEVPTIVAYPDMLQIFDWNEANKLEMTLQLLYDHLQ